MVISNWQLVVGEKNSIIHHDEGQTTNDEPPTANRSRSNTQYAVRFTFHVSRFALPLSLFLAGVGGGFAPWIWRESVAAQLTGPGLAEFVKFLPEIRTGAVQIQRLYFLLPLFVAMLLLPLAVENRQLALPRWLRWLLRLTVIPMALAALSPVWTPAILMASEFRLQTLLAVVAVGLAVSGPLWRWLPLKLLVAVMTVGAIAAIILPWQQFSLIQAAVSAAYDQPVSLGWGWWLTVVGLMASIGGGIGVVVAERNEAK